MECHAMNKSNTLEDYIMIWGEDSWANEKEEYTTKYTMYLFVCGGGGTSQSTHSLWAEGWQFID